MMEAIWHPESASISPQAQKQQSVSLPMKDNLLQEQSGHKKWEMHAKKKMALYNILYIFDCFTDSRPTIFYSLKEEDAER